MCGTLTIFFLKEIMFYHMYISLLMTYFITESKEVYENLIIMLVNDTVLQS
jgi:hypothetical protein